MKTRFMVLTTLFKVFNDNMTSIQSVLKEENSALKGEQRATQPVEGQIEALIGGKERNHKTLAQQTIEEHFKGKTVMMIAILEMKDPIGSQAMAKEGIRLDDVKAGPRTTTTRKIDDHNPLLIEEDGVG